MTTEYLNLKDAEAFTGKSRSTLRRFVEGITRPENHPDRHFIEPSVEDVKKLHAANNPFAWRINRDLLEREFRKQGSQPEKATGAFPDNDRLVAVLEKSIAMLETELREKNQQIAQFQERQREFNVLLRSVNEQLALAAAPKAAPVPEPTIEIVPTKAPAAKKAAAAPKPKKKGFWSIFGSTP